MIAMILTNVIIPILVAGLCILAYLLSMRKIRSRQNEAEAHMDNIIDTLPVLYYLEEMLFDDAGTVVDLKICKINQRCREYLKGKDDPVGQYSSSFFPAGQNAFLGAANSARQLGTQVNFQYYEEPTGIYYDCMAQVKKGTNFVEYFLMDSTNLHKTQEALKGLSRQMEVALDVSHVTPICIYPDTQLVTCQLLDKQNGKRHLKNVTLTGDELFSNFDPEDYMKLRRQLEELAEGKVPRVKYDMECVEDRGEGMKTEWHEVRVVVGERDANGKPKTLVGSIQLVTKRKLAEKTLVEAKKKAEELNSLKSAFLANMSHEIRTPLNAIVGFSELLINAETPEEQQEYSRIIQSNSNQLLQLVGDILDLSKIEAGTMEFIDKDFDLNSVMRETEETLLLRLDPEKPVTFHCELGLPECTLHCDHNRLVQVITNLVTNAIKYTDSGSITMGYKRMGNQLQFYVRDTGAGIDPQHINDIFDRFVKLNAFMKGNGLGLSICKSIVTRFGGKIWAESELGKGSTFYFTIPYNPSAVHHEQPKPAPQPTEAARQAIAHSSAPVKPSDKINILVAEDNESNYKLVSAILSREYNLTHAWNGQEAVDMFDEFKPKLVIMDINMPVMDGYEAAAILKQRSPKTPILALTAYATNADEEKILASGMDAYMSKPVCMPQLKMRIKSLLEQADK